MEKSCPNKKHFGSGLFELVRLKQDGKTGQRALRSRRGSERTKRRPEVLFDFRCDRNAFPPQNGDEPIRGPCPFGRGVEPDKRLQRYTRFRSIGQPSTEIVPVAAHRQRGNADRAAKIEREYLRSLIATKLERHEGQKHRLAGAGWTHNQGVTDVADMNGKPERGGAFGPAEEQWGRTEMLVPFRSRPHG